MVTSPPQWQRPADERVRFEIRTDSCPVDGDRVLGDADVFRWARGSVAGVVVTNATDEPAGFSVWTARPGASLDDIRADARTHIPSQYDEFLAATLIAPGGSSSVAIQVDAESGALHCFLPLRSEGADLPAALYSAG